MCWMPFNTFTTATPATVTSPATRCVITASGDGYLLDFDLADPFPALRSTRYRLADLGSRTLAAWQEADVRAFAAMLGGLLETRRTTLGTVLGRRRR